MGSALQRYPDGGLTASRPCLEASRRRRDHLLLWAKPPLFCTAPVAMPSGLHRACRLCGRLAVSGVAGGGQWCPLDQSSMPWHRSVATLFCRQGTCRFRLVYNFFLHSIQVRDGGTVPANVAAQRISPPNTQTLIVTTAQHISTFAVSARHLHRRLQYFI